MTSRTYAVHTTDENIRRLDEWAKRLRRSRNSLMNEGIEMVLEALDADEEIRQIRNRNKKKVGAR